MQHAAQGIREPRKLLDVDILAGDDLGLQALDLDSQGRSLPDENLARLAKLVLPAEVISESDGDIPVAPRDYAAPVDAAQ